MNTIANLYQDPLFKTVDMLLESDWYVATINLYFKEHICLPIEAGKPKILIESRGTSQRTGIAVPLVLKCKDGTQKQLERKFDYEFYADGEKRRPLDVSLVAIVKQYERTNAYNTNNGQTLKH